MKQISAHILISVFVFLSAFSFYTDGRLEALELFIYDQLIKLYPAVTTTSPITVITITEDDISKLKQWPISDDSLVKILEQLHQLQTRVIGIDIYRDIPVNPGHKKLENQFLHHRNIIAPMLFGNNQSDRIAPPPSLSNTEQFGFTDIPLDQDGIARRSFLYLDDGQTVFYSLAFRVALQFLQHEGISLHGEGSNLILGATRIKPFEASDGGYVDADAGGFQFFMDFCNLPAVEAIPRYKLQDFQSGEIQTNDFKDKIVLIGVIAESLKDFIYTPCSGGSEKKQWVSGVLFHAAVIDQLLRIAKNAEQPLTTASDKQEILWFLLWTLLGVFISQRQNTLWQLSLVWLGGLTVLSIITILLFTNGLWLISATPAMCWLLSSLLSTANKAAQEKQQRSQLMSLFSKHVAPEIAEEIWQNQQHFFSQGRPRPQQTTATVIFTDVQNFTQLAESLEPEVLFDWLNQYLEAMTPIVANHGGVVIRFIGDAIFGGFGIPVPRRSESEIRQDAINAVKCALAMQQQLIQLNKKWQQQSLPIIGMRIGIYTGPIATGSIGARDRMEYTIHGDTVNIAARLETFEKSTFFPSFFKYPCRILIGEKTLSYLGDQFQIEAMGRVELQGKKKEIDMYQVIDMRIHR